ncbi:hypothetical protein ACFWXA_13245 [Streptomyces atroolivaceus]|uniref:hypothetical protein n=1 Tax=Streptomyces atroolivaceus TaxID=66869 RepID=UPI0036522EDF
MTDNPTGSPTENSPLIAAARAFASFVEPGDRNAEIAQLGDRAGLVLVHSPDDFDPHFARPDKGMTVCAQQVYRVLNTEMAARVSVLCTACETTAQRIATDAGATERTV